MIWNPLRRMPQAATMPAPVPETKSGSGGFLALHLAGHAAWTTREYAALAREGYMRNPVVHRCVRMICEAVSHVPLLVYDGVTELEDHPVCSLLRRPNTRHGGPVFMETVTGHLLLSGNAYVEHVALPSGTGELHALRPDHTMIATDDAGWPVAIRHRVGGNTRQITLGAVESGGSGLHLALFHPLDDINGMPPLEAALMALDIHNAAGVWNKALLDNSARPSGALVYQPKDANNLSDEQFARLKSELEEGYSGASRAGRPLLLEGGLDWKAMGLTPKDMDFIEAKNAASRDIALAFGVPPMLLGIPGDNTYANYQEANRAFYRQTVLPLVKRIASDFTGFLCEGDMRVEPDPDQIDGLAAEREALWARIGAADFLTEDEKREAVGYRPSSRA
jgi:HK97 family phage portal protein